MSRVSLFIVFLAGVWLFSCGKVESPTGSARPVAAGPVADDQAVALAGGVSPDKRFEVVLEADKGSPRFKTYEGKGESQPAFLILEAASRRILMRLLWPGDSGSDEQPLRRSCSVLWSPASHAFVLNTQERFYSHSEVWAYDGSQTKFIEVELPDYKTLTGFDEPDSKKLNARGHSDADWDKDGHLVYDLMLSPGGSYD